jgi:Zinc finger, C3HC4 type (RING finger)
VQLAEAEFEAMKNFSGKGGGAKRDNECVVCLDKPKDHVIMNCMHLCLCEDCAVDFSEPKAKCPMCSKRVRKVVRIFT